MRDPAEARNLLDLRAAAEAALDADAAEYLAGGADDGRTLARNESAFAALGIRARRLVDVSRVDTSVRVLGETLASPILLAPVGYQRMFHPDGEVATAAAAGARGHRMILSSLSNRALAEVTAASGRPPWFQLYPTPDRRVTEGLVRRAEEAGCPVLVLTVDTPVLGNRERHGEQLEERFRDGTAALPLYAGLGAVDSPLDPALTWEIVPWLRERCGMKLVLKGVVTREDAERAVAAGADGVVVSNHGGRQEESDRATIECLPEVVEAAAGRMAVLLDSGVRRGTDVFKALALGADAVCIGRPYVWGLAAGGRAGVERALAILQEELARILRLAGAPAAAGIGPDFLAT